MELKHLVNEKAEAQKLVLIVPFMELKHKRRTSNTLQNICLNRTFYGIETGLFERE